MIDSKKGRTSSSLRRALLDGSYQSLTNIYFLLIRGIYVVVLASILGAEFYGQYVFAQSWYLLALTASTWGMNELVIAEWIRTEPSRQKDLTATGLGLRLLLGITMTVIVAGSAMLFEPDRTFRLLIMIYAQGIVVRGITGWFVVLFVARERSQYGLYLTVPFLTLEVVVAIVLALQGAGLIVIALAQCMIWWLTLFAAWFMYRSNFELLTPRFNKRYLAFFLRKGASLALAAFLLGWLGPGLLIIYRYLSTGTEQLGEAAFVIQMFVILGQAIRVVSNSALPQLNRQVTNLRQRQGFYAETIWKQSLYLGGAGFVLGYWTLQPILLAVIGPDFARAASLFSRFCWLLIPLLLISGLRLVLISNNLSRGFLLAIIVGVMLLAAQLAIISWLGNVSLDALLTALGISYCGIAAIIIATIQRRLALFTLTKLLVPFVLLFATLASFFVLGQYSPVLAVLLASTVLSAASFLEFRAAHRELTNTGSNETADGIAGKRTARPGGGDSPGSGS